MNKMKRILGLLLLPLFAVVCHARMEGWYQFEITKDVKTPSLEWLEKTPDRIRVFYISSYMMGRNIVEIAQRMNIDFQAFTGAPGGVTDHYGAVVIGATPAEARERFRGMLSGEYDVVLLYGTNLNEIPADFRFELLNRVREGKTNLVIARDARWQTNQYKKLFENPVPLPGFVHQYSLPLEVPKNLTGDNLKTVQAEINRENEALSCAGMQCFQFGKGRIVLLKILAADTDAAGYMARYESRMAMTMQALRWAAHGDDPVAFAAPDLENNPKLEMAARDIQFYLSGKSMTDAKGEVRIRNEFNEIEATVPLNRKNGFRFHLPQLPAGKYFADVRFFDGREVLAHGVYRFELKSPLGDVNLGSQEIFRDGAKPKGNVSFRFAQPEDMTLRIRIKDLPGGKTWAQKEYPVPAGTRKVDFDFDNCRNPAVVGLLFAELLNGKGEILGRAVKKIYFPNLDPGDYLIFGWGGPCRDNILQETMLLQDYFGFSAGINATGLVEFNYRAMPGFSHITIGTSKDTKETTDIAWGGKPKYTDNIYNPEIRKTVEKEVADFMASRNWWKFSPVAFNLGDENGLNLNAGIGPNDAIYLRQMLKEKYKTIEFLNQQYGTNWKSFDEVPNNPYLEELNKGNYPAWNDHIEYIQKTYADWHTVRAKAIRARMPGVRVGAEGSHAGNLEQTIENLQFWGPYGDGEDVRSFSGDRLRTSWYGYHGERDASQQGGYPWVIRSLFTGVVSGMGWFTCEYAGGSMSILASDLRPAYDKHFVDALNEMRFGLGQILAVNPFLPSGIAVYYSEVNSRMTSVSPKCVYSGDSWGVLLNHCYRTGRSFTMISDRTLNRLNNKDVKVLFLCGASVIPEKTAAKIREFVKNGGTVVADLNPGMFNQYVKPVEANMLGDLFSKDLTLKNVPEPVLKPIDFTGKLNGQDLALKAKYARQSPDSLFRVTEFGKGKSILLNFALSPADTTADPSAPMSKFLDGLLCALGEPAPFQVEVPENLDPYIVRSRIGKDFRLIGILGFDKAVQDSMKASFRLPEKKFVYKCKSGFVGETDLIRIRFNDGDSKPLDKFPLQLFAVFDQKQTAPALQVPDRVELGGSVPLDMSRLPKGRVYYLQVFTPDGKESRMRSQVLNTDRIDRYDFPIACDDPEGTWKFVFMDVATGLQQQFKVKAVSKK